MKLISIFFAIFFFKFVCAEFREIKHGNDKEEKIESTVANEDVGKLVVNSYVTESTGIPLYSNNNNSNKDVLEYSIFNNVSVCAIFRFNCKIKYVNNNGITVDLNEKTVINNSSKCGDHETNLYLNANGNENEVLKLHLVKINEFYSLNQILFTNESTYENNSTIFNITDSRFYSCNANQDFELKSSNSSVILTFFDLQIDAFKKNIFNNTRTAADCDLDKVHDFVPLAVGFALVSLVIIVLVAYIIGRKRNRRMTYQTV